MRIDEFNKAVKEQLLTCENMLLNKGHEYAPDAVETNEVDRLAHFKKAAAITGKMCIRDRVCVLELTVCATYIKVNQHSVVIKVNF